jgi:hypothetical protein
MGVPEGGSVPGWGRFCFASTLFLECRDHLEEEINLTARLAGYLSAHFKKFADRR